MYSIIIGITSALLIILLFTILNRLEKKVIYGLILSGIGFLYVGFAWTDLQTLIINAIQAVLFLLIAYFGIVKYKKMVAAGFFLHGCWDIAYSFIATPGLIPPQYEWFCLSLDFTISIYLVIYNKQLLSQGNIS